MRILQLIYSLSGAGAEKITIDLSNELSKKHEVYLCVIQKEDEILSFLKNQLNKNINYINLGCLKGNNFKTFFTIFDLLNRIRPEVVHAHLNTKLYIFLPSLIFKNKIKFVHTIHNLAPKDVGYSWQKRLNKYFYKKRLINGVAISQECKDSFIKYYNHSNVYLVENGVSSPKTTKNFLSVKEEVNNLKLKTSDIVFIHVARFSEQKNQEMLVNVFNRLVRENYKVNLIVLGANFDSLEAKTVKKNSNPSIHYLGAKTNVTDYLLSSDAFVLSSLWEGLPISLLEAMSCGVIPVCTPAGGIPDVVKDKTLGYISKDFTEQGLYEAAIKCINNMDQFDRENLKNFFNTNFSIEKCAKEYIRIYN